MAEIAGLKLIVPSSVAGSGVSVSASGKVTYTAAASVSVNGCFTSSYDNYLVVIRHTADSPRTVRTRWRVSGGDNSTANSYISQFVEADNTAINGSRSTLDYAPSMNGYTRTSGIHWYIYGPALAQPTASRTVSVYGYLDAYILDFAKTHNQSTAYDGFTLYVTAGNLTGSLCVYGLSQ